MSIEQIIARQERELENVITDSYVIIDSNGRGFENVKDFHSSSIKEILEGVQEFMANYAVDLCENSQEFKKDTINHLESIISKLTKNE